MSETPLLEGRVVRLEPLTIEHLDELWDVARDPALWTLSMDRMESVDDLRAYLDRAFAMEAADTALPYAVRHKASGRMAGSTRLANLDRANKRVEIGWTWYGAEFQRTGVNTECKLLLLTHAFERMGMNRVEWKTDALNTRSRQAILRLGAKEEGTFRHHMVAWSGRLRDTVYFSMLREEWPEAKSRLENRLGA